MNSLTWKHVESKNNGQVGRQSLFNNFAEPIPNPDMCDRYPRVPGIQDIVLAVKVDGELATRFTTTLSIQRRMEQPQLFPLVLAQRQYL